jgi:hypothetical protein
MESDSFDGGRTCRAVRYRMRTKPLFTHCCHCRWCQRETGSAFALNALIEADRVAAEYYRARNHWPEESLERVAALRAANAR